VPSGCSQRYARRAKYSDNGRSASYQICGFQRRFATIAGNHVAVCAEPDDLDTFMKVLDSPATAEAMAFDGVKRETVKVFVLDKEFKV
jgi:hypothetical protein